MAKSKDRLLLFILINFNSQAKKQIVKIVSLSYKAKSEKTVETTDRVETNVTKSVTCFSDY